MGNFEAFIEDYMTYKTRNFSNGEKCKGVAAIVGAAGGILGLTGLAIFFGTTVIPGINAVTAALGVTIPPVLICKGLRIIAQDNSWSQMDFQTRMNIIAGVVLAQKVIGFDLGSLSN